MPARILVGRSFREPAFVCIAVPVGIMLAFATLLVYSGNPDTRLQPTTWLLVCTPCVLLVSMLGWRIHRQQRWLMDTGTGLVYQDYRGTVEVDDNQVSGLGSRSRLGYIRGEPTTTTRTAVIVVGEERHECPVRYSYRLSKGDPFAGLFQRLDRAVRERAVQTLADGGLIHGNGWAFASDGLWLETQSGPRHVPRSQIVAAEIIDHHACVWIKDQSEPVLRRPDGDVNATVLVSWLRANLPKSADSDEALGRLLFRRDHGWRSVRYWTASVVVIAFIWISMLAAAADGLKLGANATYLIGGAIAALAGLILLLKTIYRKKVFECFSNGVRHETATDGERTILFSAIDSFAYSAEFHTAHTDAGRAYIWTWFDVEFLPKPGHGSPIRFSFSTTSRDAAFDELRDLIARRIAAYWQKELKETGYQQWTCGIAFTAIGLVFQKRAALVPYTHIGNSQFHAGYFYLYDRSGAELICEAISTPNFFPGLTLLAILMEANQPSTPPPPWDEEPFRLGW